MSSTACQQNPTAPAPAPARRCAACHTEMGPAEGDYAVCRDCRLGPPDPSAERDMTGIRTHLPSVSTRPRARGAP